VRIFAFTLALMAWFGRRVMAGLGPAVRGSFGMAGEVWPGLGCSAGLVTVRPGEVWCGTAGKSGLCADGWTWRGPAWQASHGERRRCKSGQCVSPCGEAGEAGAGSECHVMAR
jgi:hypothetical protein